MVRADRDVEARVWVAYSDVPGLATGADPFEDLVEKLKTAVPELLQENGLFPAFAGNDDISFFLLAQRIERAAGSLLRPTNHLSHE